jgi:lipoprotein-releasing system permease protein
MLVTVKKMDFHTLGVMGLSDKDNKKIARLFGTAVITIGLVSGLILGISMIFLQNSFGLIAINVEGRFIDNLPMTIEWYQLVLLVFIIFIVGKLFIELPVSQIKNYNLKPNV